MVSSGVRRPCFRLTALDSCGAFLARGQRGTHRKRAEIVLAAPLTFRRSRARERAPDPERALGQRRAPGPGMALDPQRYNQR